MLKDTIFSLLTYQEIEIMGLIINGYKYKKISEKLNISEYMVAKTVKSVIRKLNAAGRINAVAIVVSEAKKINIL